MPLVRTPTDGGTRDTAPWHLRRRVSSTALDPAHTEPPWPPLLAPRRLPDI